LRARQAGSPPGEPVTSGRLHSLQRLTADRRLDSWLHRRRVARAVVAHFPLTGPSHRGGPFSMPARRTRRAEHSCPNTSSASPCRCTPTPATAPSATAGMGARSGPSRAARERAATPPAPPSGDPIPAPRGAASRRTAARRSDHARPAGGRPSATNCTALDAVTKPLNPGGEGEQDPPPWPPAVAERDRLLSGRSPYCPGRARRR
jgi:hypothetical protein